MVCDRCKSAVIKEINDLNINFESVELGQATLIDVNVDDLSKLTSSLNNLGFEVLNDEADVLIENLKIAIINKIESQDYSNLSIYLSLTFNKSYPTLSKIFSIEEGITIEKYRINLKMEKVKELIQLGELNFSEIAYQLDYTDSGHLAKQFKHETGMSMSEFKNLQIWDRKSLDDIV